MRKYYLIVGILVFFTLPTLAISAPSLSSKLRGKILLAVEDKGKTYFVYDDGYRYQVNRETAQNIFEKLAIGISNKDLAQIPERKIEVGVVGGTTELDVCKKALQVDLKLISDYGKEIQASKRLISEYESTSAKLVSQVNSALSVVGSCQVQLEQWKAKAYELSSTVYQQNHIPLTKCYSSGSSFECYDVSVFSSDLKAQLDAIDNNAYLSQSSKESRKLKAIQDYYKQ